MSSQPPPPPGYAQAPQGYPQQPPPGYYPPQQPPKKSHTLRNVLIAIGVVFILMLGGCMALLAGAANEVDKAIEKSEISTDGLGSGKQSKNDGGGSGSADQEEPEEPSLTTGQENAIASAEMYLETAPFSRTGLIRQLKFEKYSEKDATFAVDNIDVNWNQEAVESAELYLEMSPMSKDALIDQLEFEGFTAEQAAFGANKAF